MLLQRLTQCIQVWCTEFDRIDDGDTRRDTLSLRDITNKRRGDKRGKDEKVHHDDNGSVLRADKHSGI